MFGAVRSGKRPVLTNDHNHAGRANTSGASLNAALRSIFSGIHGEPQSRPLENDQSVVAIQNARLFSEIEEKGKQLAVASQHKSQFLANMSHELRTPLNAIIGFSEIMASGMFGALGSDKYVEYCRDIHGSGEYLLDVINDVLDMSKIEVGKLELREENVDLGAAVRTCVALGTQRAIIAGVMITTEIEENLIGTG